jgi:hypothetical protein
MTDVFDQATEREIADREFAIKAALQRIEDSRLKPRGTCHNCDEPLEFSHNLFCDADCGSDYELRTRMKRG